MAKYVFVTGGVTSSLGKGITAASVGRLLKARGLHVSILKLDPYINVDPGTMSPYQHGEVFVTDDGAETDLDLGHYERFIDENLTQLSNVVVLNGVKVVGPTRTAALQFLVPGLAVLLAFLFLQEPIRPGQVLGGAIILGGVLITRRDIVRYRPTPATRLP